MRLLIIGAGGHGQVIADTAQDTGLWTEIAFLDKRPNALPPDLPWQQVSNGDEELHHQIAISDGVIVGIGESRIRDRLLEALPREKLATIVSAHAVVSQRAVVGAGSVVFAGAVIQIGAQLGVGTVINTGASVDHHCRLDRCVHVAAGARLGGNVHVGARSWVGIGASVLHGQKLGADVRVEPGACVVSDIEDGLTVAGVPAKPRVPAKP